MVNKLSKLLTFFFYLNRKERHFSIIVFDSSGFPGTELGMSNFFILGILTKMAI